MTEQPQPTSVSNLPVETQTETKASRHHRDNTAIKAFLLLVILVIGIGGGYLMGKNSMHDTAMATGTPGHSEVMSMMEEINPPEGYAVPASFGDVGPRLVAAGGIDLVKFVALYKQQNRPLSEEQMKILQKGSPDKIIFTPQNAYFLLNFFWAVGLTNQNEILTSGPMVSGGIEKVGGFASTGGWSLGAEKATNLYSSTKLVSLTDEQQARLLEVASAVYRPCCDNPTHFPDCNHGMAMLGLLELMASQNASTDEMFEAAKYVNAFWYPQQILEIATMYKSANKLDFADVDAREVVSYKYSSASGFQAVHQWLTQNGLLEQAPGSSGSCGVK